MSYTFCSEWCSVMFAKCYMDTLLWFIGSMPWLYSSLELWHVLMAFSCVTSSNCWYAILNITRSYTHIVWVLISATFGLKFASKVLLWPLGFVFVMGKLSEKGWQHFDSDGSWNDADTCHDMITNCVVWAFCYMGSEDRKEISMWAKSLLSMVCSS